jgi:hypothetical protein
MKEVEELLVRSGVIVYPVAPTYPEYIRLASVTGGRFYNIESGDYFSDILISLAEDISKSMLR